MADTFAFYLFSALAIVASAFVIGQRNPMYSVLLLVGSFGAMAGLFITLDAPFVAIALMIVYAGAIMVLFLFVVMLLNAPREDAASWDQIHPLRHPVVTRVGGLFAALLIIQLVYALVRGDLSAPIGSRAGATPYNSVTDLGHLLFTSHSFAFEATSILILVAMIGAVVLARRESGQ